MLYIVCLLLLLWCHVLTTVIEEKFFFDQKFHIECSPSWQERHAIQETEWTHFIYIQEVRPGYKMSKPVLVTYVFKQGSASWRISNFPKQHYNWEKVFKYVSLWRTFHIQITALADSCISQVTKLLLVILHEGTMKNLEMSEINDENKGAMF